MTRRVILASQSPCRRELMGDIVADFDIVVSDVDEVLTDELSGSNLAKMLAKQKADVIAARYPEAIVIGADTVVAIDGQNLGKPRDDAEAFAMLQMLSGKMHQVSTGVSVQCRALGYDRLESETAEVTMRPFDAAATREYIATGDPMDKAAAYGIQTPAAQFLFDHIEGGKDTIMGLPQKLVSGMLTEVEALDQSARGDADSFAPR